MNSQYILGKISAKASLIAFPPIRMESKNFNLNKKSTD